MLILVWSQQGPHIVLFWPFRPKGGNFHKQIQCVKFSGTGREWLKVKPSPIFRQKIGNAIRFDSIRILFDSIRFENRDPTRTRNRTRSRTRFRKNRERDSIRFEFYSIRFDSKIVPDSRPRSRTEIFANLLSPIFLKIREWPKIEILHTDSFCKKIILEIAPQAKIFSKMTDKFQNLGYLIKWKLCKIVL